MDAYSRLWTSNAAMSHLKGKRNTIYVGWIQIYRFDQILPAATDDKLRERKEDEDSFGGPCFKFPDIHCCSRHHIMFSVEGSHDIWFTTICGQYVVKHPFIKRLGSRAPSTPLTLFLPQRPILSFLLSFFVWICRLAFRRPCHNGSPYRALATYFGLFSYFFFSDLSVFPYLCSHFQRFDIKWPPPQTFLLPVGCWRNEPRNDKGF